MAAPAFCTGGSGKPLGESDAKIVAVKKSVDYNRQLVVIPPTLVRSRSYWLLRDCRCC